MTWITVVNVNRIGHDLQLTLTHTDWDQCAFSLSLTCSLFPIAMPGTVPSCLERSWFLYVYVPYTRLANWDADTQLANMFLGVDTTLRYQ